MDTDTNFSPQSSPAGEPAGASLHALPRAALVSEDLLPFPIMEQRVTDAGPVRFLVEGLWPEDAYGVVGAEPKAGKTWFQLDLCVSVATGTPWLGRFPVKQGYVATYCGEGGARNIVRRIRAICESKGIPTTDLDTLWVGERAPHLNDPRAVEQLAIDIEEFHPTLVVVDPLYLAGAGSKGSDLYAMAETLGPIQAICQSTRSALVLVHHWNKTGSGSGAQRFTGTGPAEWGRVLGSGDVRGSRTLLDGRSAVDVSWEFTGSEIPERSFDVHREVWSDDPFDLSSPLHYEVRVIEGLELMVQQVPSRGEVLAVLQARPGQKYTRKEIVAGTNLAANTVIDALASLLANSEIEGDVRKGVTATYWIDA